MTSTKQFHYTYFLRIFTCRMQGRHSVSRWFPATREILAVNGDWLYCSISTSQLPVNELTLLVWSGSSLARMLLSSDSAPASYLVGTKPGSELGSHRTWLRKCIAAGNPPFGTVQLLISESFVEPLRKTFDLFALKTKFVARVDGRIILRWIFRK